MIFVNSTSRKSRNVIFCSFSFQWSSRQLQEMKFKRPNALFLTWKVVFKKSDTFFLFFCTNHSSGLLCSCKRFCVVDFWPLFRFFGITKAPFSFKSSQGRRKSSVRTQKEKEFLLWLFGHFCDIVCAFTVIAPNTQLFWLYWMPISQYFYATDEAYLWPNSQRKLFFLR